MITSFVTAFRRVGLPATLLALAVLGYAIAFSLMTVNRFHAFEARALDLGNLHQAIWNTAHAPATGDWFRLTNQQADVTNRLSLHVEPILLPIAAIYRLFPTVEFLLILQSVVVALGAVPLFLLARRQLRSEWAALLFGCVFLLNPTMQAANWLEFHPLTLAPSLIIAAVAALKAGRMGWFALFCVLAAACKEEIGLLVGMIGLYAFIVEKRRRAGLLTLVLGWGWALTAVLLIQPLIAGDNIHWGRYDYLGVTTTDKLVALFTRPDLLFAQLQVAGAGRYFFELLFPVAFLSLLAPELLLLALPSLAINLLADFAPMHEVTSLIYAAPIVPFVMVAAVGGMKRLVDWLIGGLGRTSPVSTNSASQPIHQSTNPPIPHLLTPSPPHPLTLAPFLTLTATALTAFLLHGYLPPGGNFRVLAITEHHRAAQGIMAQIPPEAVVSAQDRLNPHVSGRRTIYIFPRVDDAEYIWLDAAGPAWPQHPSDLRKIVAELLADDFGVAAADDGYLLLQRGAPSDVLPPAFFRYWQRAEEAVSEPPLARGEVWEERLQLHTVAAGADRNGELLVTAHWETLQPSDEDLRFYFGLLDAEGKILHDSRFYPPAAVLWYPTSLWQPGPPGVTVTTLPWTLAVDRFTLVMGVYRGEDGWEAGDRLQLTTVASDSVAAENDTLLRIGAFERSSAGGWQPVPPATLDAGPPRLLDVEVAGSFRLAAVAVPETVKSGAQLPVQLRWVKQQGAPLAGDYVRFVQLFDSSGAKVAQVDGPPADEAGVFPTTQWGAARDFVDAVTLALPADLPPGAYSLIAGFYAWETGERLPVTGTAAFGGDAIDLGVVQVEK